MMLTIVLSALFVVGFTLVGWYWLAKVGVFDD